MLVPFLCCFASFSIGAVCSYLLLNGYVSFWQLKERTAIRLTKSEGGFTAALLGTTHQVGHGSMCGAIGTLVILCHEEMGVEILEGPSV